MDCGTVEGSLGRVFAGPGSGRRGYVVTAAWRCKLLHSTNVTHMKGHNQKIVGELGLAGQPTSVSYQVLDTPDRF